MQHDNGDLEKVFALHSLLCGVKQDCFSGLSFSKAVGDILDLTLSLYLPGVADCVILHENYSILLARVIVKELHRTRLSGALLIDKQFETVNEIKVA